MGCCISGADNKKDNEPLLKKTDTNYNSQHHPKFGGSDSAKRQHKRDNNSDLLRNARWSKDKGPMVSPSPTASNATVSPRIDEEKHRTLDMPEWMPTQGTFSPDDVMEISALPIEKLIRMYKCIEDAPAVMFTHTTSAKQHKFLIQKLQKFNIFCIHRQLSDALGEDRDLERTAEILNRIARRSARTKFVSVNTIEVYYELIECASKYAHNIPLVLISECGAVKEDWAMNLLEELSKTRRVLVFDNRGSGQTGVPTSQSLQSRYTIDLLASDTAALIEAVFHMQPVFVLGVGMGGMVAATLCHRFAHLVHGLVLCSTSGGGLKCDQANQYERIWSEHPFCNGIREEMTASSRLQLVEQRDDSYAVYATKEFDCTFQFGATGAESVSYNRPITGLKPQRAAIRKFRDRGAAHAQIRVPTLLLHGEDDHMYPASNVDALRDALENCAETHVAIFPSLDHLWWTAPEAHPDCVKRIRDFLADIERRSVVPYKIRVLAAQFINRDFVGAARAEENRPPPNDYDNLYYARIVSDAFAAVPVDQGKRGVRSLSAGNSVPDNDTIQIPPNFPERRGLDCTNHMIISSSNHITWNETISFSVLASQIHHADMIIEFYHQELAPDPQIEGKEIEEEQAENVPPRPLAYSRLKLVEEEFTPTDIITVDILSYPESRDPFSVDDSRTPIINGTLRLAHGTCFESRSRDPVPPSPHISQVFGYNSSYDESLPRQSDSGGRRFGPFGGTPFANPMGPNTTANIPPPILPEDGEILPQQSTPSPKKKIPQTKGGASKESAPHADSMDLYEMNF